MTHPSFRPEIIERREREFAQAATADDVTKLVKKWQREDTELERTENSQGNQIRALEARVRHLERTLLSSDRSGLSDDLIDTIAFALVDMRRKIESQIPRFCGPHEAARTYEAHSLVVKAGSLWISLVRTVKPPGTDDWQLITKQG
jgi:hypothetical protein